MFCGVKDVLLEKGIFFKEMWTPILLSQLCNIFSTCRWCHNGIDNLTKLEKWKRGINIIYCYVIPFTSSGYRAILKFVHKTKFKVIYLQMVKDTVDFIKLQPNNPTFAPCLTSYISGFSKSLNFIIFLIWSFMF